MKLEGGCACGAVRFVAEGAPWRVGLCHCMTCRKATGSVFNAFAIYPRPAVRTTGTTAIWRSSEHGRQHFCPACGSPVFAQDVGGDETELPLGAFDEPDRFRPTYEGFVGRRESWLPPLPGVRQYAGNREGPGRAEPGCTEPGTTG